MSEKRFFMPHCLVCTNLPFCTKTKVSKLSEVVNCTPVNFVNWAAFRENIALVKKLRPDLEF